MRNSGSNVGDLNKAIPVRVWPKCGQTILAKHNCYVLVFMCIMKDK